MTGRRGVLTDEIHERIIAALKTGAYVKDAAAYAGMSERTVYEWMSRGNAYEDHLAEGGDIKKGEDQYRLLALEANQARADARISAAATLRKAWQEGDWRAAMVYLERTDPQHWGRVQRVEMTGIDGGPVAIADVTEVEKRLAESLRSRLQVVNEHVEGSEVVDAVVVDAKVRPALEAGAAAFALEDDDDDYYIWPTW